MTIENILNSLHKVKSTGHGTYIACCPAHDDRSPSMTIRECDDGRILLHCFGGCEPQSILSSIGMEFGELFPQPIYHRGKPLRRPFPVSDVLTTVHFEVQLVALAAANMAQGMEMTEKDRARLILAAQRLNEALYLSGVK